MSKVYMTIENITENFEYDNDGIETKVYSVIDNMNCYRVTVEEGCCYEAHDQEMNVLDDYELAGTLIDQVIEFEKGE